MKGREKRRAQSSRLEPPELSLLSEPLLQLSNAELLLKAIRSPVARSMGSTSITAAIPAAAAPASVT